MKVTLARAMKEKNRLAGKMQEWEEKIRIFNLFENPDKEILSILKLGNLKTDIAQEFSNRQKAVKMLSQIKATIAEANSKNGISEMIYEKEEIKAYISFLKRVPVNEHVKDYALGEDKIAYVRIESQISSQEINEIVKQLQKRVEELQDKIDELNASVYVELPEFE